MVTPWYGVARDGRYCAHALQTENGLAECEATCTIPQSMPGSTSPHRLSLSDNRGPRCVRSHETRGILRTATSTVTLGVYDIALDRGVNENKQSIHRMLKHLSLTMSVVQRLPCHVYARPRGTTRCTSCWGCGGFFF